jgi:hypothetical protein
VRRTYFCIVQVERKCERGGSASHHDHSKNSVLGLSFGLSVQHPSPSLDFLALVDSEFFLAELMPLDVHSHLVSQGWTGSGTGLRQGAISRPLAIPQKKTLAGLGKDRDEAFPFWDQCVPLLLC